MNYQEFKNKLKECQLNIREFSDLTGINSNGISYNWKKVDTIPKWAETWLDNYQKAQLIDDIKSKLCSDNSNN
jgi:hypothetical protein